MTGTSGLAGSGKVLNNRINGDPGTEVLSGLAGNDTLNGAAGSDTLTGGAGAADRFVFGSLVGADAVADFDSASDAFRSSPEGLSVGNGDRVVDDTQTRPAAGGFSVNAEWVISSADTAGALANASAAAAIGTANGA